MGPNASIDLEVQVPEGTVVRIDDGAVLETHHDDDLVGLWLLELHHLQGGGMLPQTLGAGVSALFVPDVVAAAQERGRARDLWATAEELLAELGGSERGERES